MGATVAAGLFSSGAGAWVEEGAVQPAVKQRYKIGVCDWMILKHQQLGAFKWTARSRNCMEVDMGDLGQRQTSTTSSWIRRCDSSST